MGDAGGVCVYGGVGEEQSGEGGCVGDVEELHGEYVRDGGERVCCVLEGGCVCCSPLVRGEALDGEFWTGIAWLDSAFKEEDEEEEVEAEEEAGLEVERAALGMGGDCTTSS